MPVLKVKETDREEIRPGVKRRLSYLNDLMMVVIDFENGPWKEPEPMHRHVHEQITYVADGELVFFCEGEPEQRLKAGDIFVVPSNKDHTIQLLSKNVKLVDSFNPIRDEFLK